MKLNYRLAKTEDIVVLSELRVLQQQDDWREEYGDLYDLRQSTRDFLKAHLNKDVFMFVCECKKRIIATCCVQIIHYMPCCNDTGKYGHICNVYTREGYRNKGIAAKLMRICIDWCKENEICELHLETDNYKAISIYREFGFRKNELAMVKVL